jgi:hypothetical protein
MTLTTQTTQTGQNIIIIQHSTLNWLLADIAAEQKKTNALTTLAA